MATLRKLKIYPDPTLHEISQPVFAFGSALRELVADMVLTMTAAGGVGLSAIQIGIPKRVVVINCEGNKRTMINPEIEMESTAEQTLDEGCLSTPGVYIPRIRSRHVSIRFQNISGESVEEEFFGMMAFCILHELDHLEGKIFIDDLSSLKKNRARGKIKKTIHMFRKDILKQKVY